MINGFKISVLACIIFTNGGLSGQTRFSAYNQSLIEPEKILINPGCLNYGSSRPIKKRNIKDDKKWILFLNDFYNKDLSKEEIYRTLKEFFNYKWSYDTSKIGAVTKYQTRVRSEGNLEIFISFSTINNDIVFKKISFGTRTRTDCISPYKYAIGVQDIKYLKEICIPIIDFPLTYYCGNGEFSCDTVFFNKLKKLSLSEYHFFLSSDDKELNTMTWFGKDTYMMDNVDFSFAEIVKRNNRQLLYELLSSPNYIVSIYAMEGLTFLRETGQIEIPVDIEEKMQKIKNANITITWQYSDVVRQGLTYKDLKVSTYSIVAKYKRSQNVKN